MRKDSKPGKNDCRTFRDCEYNRNRATDEVIRDVIVRVLVVVCDERDDSLLRVHYEEVLEEFYHPLIGGA